MEVLFKCPRDQFRSKVRELRGGGATGKTVAKDIFARLSVMTNQHVVFMPTEILNQTRKLRAAAFTQSGNQAGDRSKIRFFKPITKTQHKHHLLRRKVAMLLALKRFTTRSIARTTGATSHQISYARQLMRSEKGRAQLL